MRRLCIFALCCCFLAPQIAWARDVSLHLASSTIQAEIADTPQARERGLMQRKTLCADCGMLFVFPFAAQYGFWMKNTPLPLSIAFIAPDGRIINIVEMQPYTTDTHSAEADALYALEMNSGWFARHHAKPGDKIEGLLSVPPANQ